MMSEQRVAEILLKCGTDESVMPPTMLYEEGWMLRLVLDWFQRHPGLEHPLSFTAGSSWYSEALLHTQFRANRRGDSLAESWTHADGVIGHFEIGWKGRGDLSLDNDADQFVVIEAKMFSGLSAGTKNAPTFNQAARNIACMAEALSQADRKSTEIMRLGFAVCAPEEQINQERFDDALDKEHIRKAVHDRVASYDGTEYLKSKDEWRLEWFDATLAAIVISLLSWEDIVKFITLHDATEGQQLAAFYSKCLEYNQRKKAVSAP